MDTQKTLQVKAELFDRIEEEAQREGVSPAELLEMAVARYLATARLQRLQRYGSERARERGLTEEDVPRLVAEYRKEKRAR